MNPQQTGYKTVVLYGASDLAEIAALCTMGQDTKIIGFVDPQGDTTELAEVAIVSELRALRKIDMVLLTDIRDCQRSCQISAR